MLCLFYCVQLCVGVSCAVDVAFVLLLCVDVVCCCWCVVLCVVVVWFCVRCLVCAVLVGVVLYVRCVGVRLVVCVVCGWVSIVFVSSLLFSCVRVFVCLWRFCL